MNGKLHFFLQYVQHVVFPAWQAAQNPAKNIFSRSHVLNYSQLHTLNSLAPKTVWYDLVRFGTFSYVLARFGPISSVLGRFGPIWADLVRLEMDSCLGSEFV